MPITSNITSIVYLPISSSAAFVIPVFTSPAGFRSNQLLSLKIQDFLHSTCLWCLTGLFGVECYHMHGLFLVCIMDWALCLVCLQKTQEALKCPLNAWGQGDKSKPYKALLTYVCTFREFKQLPVSLNFGEEMNIGQLVAHQA